jgi:hypothetical protein
VTYGRLQVQNMGQTITKIDYQASAKHSLFGRFMYSSNDQPSPLKSTANELPGSPQKPGRDYGNRPLA